MRNIKTSFSILSICFILFVTSCSNDDDENSMQNVCIADDFELVETAINDSPESNRVSITFDLTNNSSSDYDISNGSPIVCTTIIVTTANGEMFETSRLLTLSSLPSGATTNFFITANYGVNRTFSSFETNFSCL